GCQSRRDQQDQQRQEKEDQTTGERILPQSRSDQDQGDWTEQDDQRRLAVSGNKHSTHNRKRRCQPRDRSAHADLLSNARRMTEYIFEHKKQLRKVPLAIRERTRRKRHETGSIGLDQTLVGSIEMSQKEEVVGKKTNSPQNCQDDCGPAQDLAARPTDKGEVHDDRAQDEDGRMREKHSEQTASRHRKTRIRATRVSVEYCFTSEL